MDRVGHGTSAKANGRDVQAELAAYFLGAEKGQRILSVRELSESLHMSVGAISIALNSLQDMGAVSIEKRGHMGSYLLDCSISKLFGISGRSPMVIAMSLPMHIRFEGLATSVKRILESSGIETYLIFIRGSRTRLKALHDNRCHAVLMSGLSAEGNENEENEIMHVLPPTTWLSGYCVFYRKHPVPGRPLRVGVDLQSSDHTRLTTVEFSGQDAELRSVSYVHITQMLKNGDIDAVVWNMDHMEDLNDPEIAFRPLSEGTMKEVGEKALSSALVGKKGDAAVRAVLQKLLDASLVMEIQAQVVEGKILAEY